MIRLPIAVNMAECSGTSMRCPLPLLSLALIAIATETEPSNAENVLAMGSGVKSGSPPLSEVSG